MITLAAAAFTILLAALAAFQIALIAGAPLGYLAWGGQDRVLPARKRAGSVVSIVLYLLFALVILERADVIDLVADNAQVAVGIATWVIAAYLALGILMNLASKSRSERLVMAPTCGVLAALAVVVALS